MAEEQSFVSQEDVDFLAEAATHLSNARRVFPPKVTDNAWLTVLTLKVGECAQAVLIEDAEALRQELAKVAAIACRWAVERETWD